MRLQEVRRLDGDGERIAYFVGQKVVHVELGLGAGPCLDRLVASDAGVEISPGRPKNGGADCVLKTDIKTFERIVKESYVPSFAEFTDGRVKTNDPNLLMQFKSVFDL